MSDSPKYCAARLRERQERRLRKEREEQAALERAQRKAEEEKRSGTRLEQTRRSALNELAHIQSALTTLANSDAVRFVQAERLKALDARIQVISPVVQETILEDRLRTIVADMQRLRDDVQALVAEAETAKLCADLAVEEAEVVKLEQRFAGLDKGRSEKFDQTGRQDVASLLQSARSHLQNRELPQARSDTEAVQQKLDNHQRDVAERFAAWQTAKTRAEAGLAAAGDQVSGLRADEVVVRWASRQIDGLEEQLAMLSKLIQDEHFDRVNGETTRLAQASESLVAHAQELQLKEERRQYIVQGIVDVMGQMGFVVQQGSPALEHPSVSTSATTIHAERIGGGAIAVSVPQEGDIWYDVAGFPMRAEATPDGKAVRTCDEAEQEILRMHEAMKEAFGIEMSELNWDGKDPDRVRKAAERLAESASASRIRGQ